jgi:peptidyl-prolyl cis-trans isomerase A (cyclophilin A)
MKYFRSITSSPNRQFTFFSAVMVLILALACSTGRGLSLVSMDTEFGRIVLEIDTVAAPVTGKNFLSLVDRGAYADAVFYRVVRMDNQPKNPVKIEVIQGGLLKDSLIDSFSPIIHETTQMTGLKHLDGSLSMARNKPGSASTEFFICIGNQPELDFGGKRNSDGQGFAAFGRVKDGMAIVRKIQQLKDRDQYLPDPVKVLIKRIR